MSDSLAVPFATRSLRRKYIVLPSGMLCDPGELRYAVAHEGQHLRNGDMVWEIILQGLKPLFFWNPAFWIWKAQADRLRELACDQTVVTRRGFNADDYCRFLLRVGQRCRRAAGSERPTAPATALASVGLSVFRKRARPVLRQRVLALLDGKARRDRARVFLGASLFLFSLVAVTAMGLQQPATVSMDRLQLKTIVNLERMAEITSEPGYNLVMAY